MRNVRKLLLLAIMAMIAAAFMASTASAQTVELRHEPASGANESHCGNVNIQGHVPSQGNCRVRAISEAPTLLFQHTTTSEMPFSACNNVFEAVFNEDGIGSIYNQVLAPEGGACGREPCDEGSGPNEHRNHVWPAEIYEPAVGGPEREEMEVTFCLYAHTVGNEGQLGVPCHILLDVFQNKVTHQIEVRTKQPADPATGEGGSACEPPVPVEVFGHWNVAPSIAHPNDIEIFHTP